MAPELFAGVEGGAEDSLAAHPPGVAVRHQVDAAAAVPLGERPGLVYAVRLRPVRAFRQLDRTVDSRPAGALFLAALRLSVRDHDRVCRATEAGTGGRTVISGGIPLQALAP